MADIIIGIVSKVNQICTNHSAKKTFFAIRHARNTESFEMQSKLIRTHQTLFIA
jgi:hypothetical protein